MFCFVLGCISALYWPGLLQPWQMVIAVFIALLLICCRFFGTAAMVIACVYWQWAAWQLMQPINTEKITARIIALAPALGDTQSVKIELSSSQFSLFNQYAILYWQQPPQLRVGEIWQLKIKPKSNTSPLNLSNNHIQRQRYANNIRLRGRIIEGKLLDTNQSWLVQLKSNFTKYYSQLSYSNISNALLFGDSSQINPQQWQQLRATASGHLFAISGLHLSLVVFIFTRCCQWLVNHCRPTPGLGNFYISLLFGFAVAAIYAYIAGLGLPLQRALIMLAVVVYLSVSQTFTRAKTRLLIAAFVVLLFDPLAALSVGFWLSFAAVSGILMLNSMVALSTLSFWRQLLLLQLWLGLWMAIWQLILFDGLSVHGLWLNLILVPLFSVVVIPLHLLVLISLAIYPSLAMLQFNDAVLALPMAMIEWGAGLSWSWLSFTHGQIQLLALMISLVISQLLRGYRLLLTTLIVINVYLEFNQSSDWQLHFLDVGQGSAAVVVKQGRGILIDTGASYFNGFSYAKQTVLPMLELLAVDQLDYLLISHDDNDHAGGVVEILSAYPKVSLISDSPLIQHWQQQAKHAIAPLNCRPKSWHWQGMKLTLLAPQRAQQGNNGSCVLMLEDHQHKILFSGDIEKKSERQLLLSNHVEEVDILLAPHHGSSTSSSVLLLNRIKPKLTVFSAGFDNRFQFPKQSIRQRYERLGLDYIVTGEQGQISIYFYHDGYDWLSFRQHMQPYWYNQALVFGQVPYLQ
ncbi:DNA internalization-related competence protein ComEC/Rec2 [Paraferrimonas sp. SM1919]|uniref:DNA internalization-related competence protein ComEC/Rec2 n=1 Tax=Paraferrimonas sp. SM1919 TaxID=2662263 RepID=UPI0013CFA309|nr:DNA internalization-related competence protein ComEC/Rec2 [Paraferrimonas sp. SM1919]